jgi:outer membrane immunogenic protein
MKKRLLVSAAAMLAIAAPASAADVATRAPVYKAAAPLFNWTGFYVGGHGGYGWGETENLRPNGWFGGGQLGYNWQYAPNWVLGIETDISGGNLSDTNAGGVPLVNSKIDTFGTGRGRLGYTVDRVMVYGTGGLAWARDRATDGLLQDDKTHVGWAAGAGLEYAFAPNWSTKLEWLYADYGGKTYALTAPTRVEPIDNTVKLGVNYRFGGGPAYSRY